MNHHPPLTMVHHAPGGPPAFHQRVAGGVKPVAGVRGRGGCCASRRPGAVECDGAAGIAADPEERAAAATWKLQEAAA